MSAIKNNNSASVLSAETPEISDDRVFGNLRVCYLKNIQQNSGALELLAKVLVLGCKGIALIRGNKAVFGIARAKFETAYSVIDTAQVFNIAFFGDKKYKDKKTSILMTIGQTAALVAGIGGLVLFLQSVSLVSLAGIGVALGKVPVFGAISALGVSFETAVATTACAAFAFLASDSAVLAYNQYKEDEKNSINTGLSLAYYVSEVTWRALAIAGCVGSSVLIPLGMLAATLGLASFGYKQALKERQEKAKEAASCA